MANTIQIKRGADKPQDNTLAPYELGISINDMQLYIGDKDQKTSGIRVAQAVQADQANTATQAESLTSILPLTGGGTGATTAESARANLGINLNLYALKTDIPALDAYALKTDLDNYALKSSLDLYALNSSLNDYAPKSSLDNYALKSSLNDYTPKNKFVSIVEGKTLSSTDTTFTTPDAEDKLWQNFSGFIFYGFTISDSPSTTSKDDGYVSITVPIGMLKEGENVRFRLNGSIASKTFDVMKNENGTLTFTNVAYDDFGLKPGTFGVYGII